SVDVLTDQVLMGDLRDAAARPGLRTYVLAPDIVYPGKNPRLNFDCGAIRTAIDHGFAVATHAVLPVLGSSVPPPIVLEGSAPQSRPVAVSAVGVAPRLADGPSDRELWNTWSSR